MMEYCATTTRLVSRCKYCGSCARSAMLAVGYRLYQRLRVWRLVIAVNSVNPVIPSRRVPFLVIAVLLFVNRLTISESKPIQVFGSHSRISEVSHALSFLIKYGYSPKSNFKIGDLRSEQHLRNAITLMQKFGNIPQTGQIDNATTELMNRKRCGLPDILRSDQYSSLRLRSKRYAIHGSKWQKTNLTWRLKLRPRNSQLDHSTLRAEVRKAFKVWSDVSKLTFEEVQRSDADIVISFVSGSHGDDYPFDGDGDVLAHAFFPGEGIGGDVHFDADEKWVRTKANEDDEGISFFGVAAHEFGHSLGLSHSSVTGSLMFPYYQTIKDDFALPYDDTVGIQLLYGSKHNGKWAPYTPYVPSEKPYEKPTTTTSVSKHPDSPVTQRPRVEHPSNIPNTCNTSFDAISSIRNEIFFFQGKYFWRLNSENQLERNIASEISIFFYNLPRDFERIDAVYERPGDGKIVFFIGSEYWLFNLHKPEDGYPRPLTNLGFSKDVKKIDAAMVWGHNGKTYFFTGDQYWRFDEKSQKVELDYPRSMDIWKGVPYHIDASFTWNKNGITYFFKDHIFWSFDNREMRVTSDSPLIATPFWFRFICKNTTRIPRIRSDDTDEQSSAGVNLLANIGLIVFVAFFYCLRYIFN